MKMFNFILNRACVGVLILMMIFDFDVDIIINCSMTIASNRVEILLQLKFVFFENNNQYKHNFKY